MIESIFSIVGMVTSYFLIGWLVLRLIYICDDEEDWDDDIGLKFFMMFIWPITLIVVICVWAYRPFQNKKEIRELRRVIMKLKNKPRKRKAATKK